MLEGTMTMEDLQVMTGDPETRPMDSEYRERQEAGTPNPIDRANAAARNADSMASMLSESELSEAAEKRFRLVRAMANRAASELKAGFDTAAENMADGAERVALSIRDMDSARFEGVALTEPLGSNGAKRAANGRNH